jgi:hypothetical protein
MMRTVQYDDDTVRRPTLRLFSKSGSAQEDVAFIHGKTTCVASGIPVNRPAGTIQAPPHGIAMPKYSSNKGDVMGAVAGRRNNVNRLPVQIEFVYLAVPAGLGTLVMRKDKDVFFGSKDGVEMAVIRRFPAVSEFAVEIDPF